MKRRYFLVGTVLLAGAFAWWKKPRDAGAPYDGYFSLLNQELKKNGPMRPCMVIDLDRMDQNIDRVTQTLKLAGKNYRIVEKSLPSQKLIEYIAQRAQTRRLMSFHQPFLNLDAEIFSGFDILMGKPLPVRSAELFYRELKGAFDPTRQLQWVIDSPQRLQEYLQLAQGLNTKLRTNLEIDVGLHRGGVGDNATLGQMLEVIAAHPQQLDFSGFMGYDAHVGMGVPHILGTSQELLAKAMAIYQGFVDYARGHPSKLWREGPTPHSRRRPRHKAHPPEKNHPRSPTPTAPRQ